MTITTDLSIKPWYMFHKYVQLQWFQFLHLYKVLKVHL